MNSRCFQFSNDFYKIRPKIPKCLIPSCDAQGQLTIQYNSEQLECQYSEQIIYPTTEVEQDFYLVCPDPVEYCKELDLSCPNDCNAKGICAMNKRCICFYGSTGEDCSESGSNLNIYHSLQIKKPQHSQASHRKETKATSKKPIVSSHRPAILKLQP